MKFTDLCIPDSFNYLIDFVPDTKSCFSELKILFCNADINDKVLIWSITISKSARELYILIEFSRNSGILN